MKKLISLLIILFLPVIAFAQDEQSPAPSQHISRSIVFSESLDKTTPSLFLKPGAVQELQNMKRPSSDVPAGWEPRSGTTRFNTTAIGAVQVKSLFHHVNSELSVDSFYAQANDQIYLASVVPPSTTTTFGTSKYTLTTSASPLFGESIGDDLIFAGSGTSPCATSGTSAYPDGFYVSRSGSTNYDSGYDFVRDTRSDTGIVGFQSTSDAIYVGYRRRAVGVYFDLGSTVNAVASGVSVYARRSGAWAEISVTDGTSTGTTTFAQDGAITWTGSALDQHYVLENTADDLFWYKFIPTGNVTDGVTVQRCIVLDRTEAITALWSGMYDLVLGALVSTTTGFVNYTGEVTDGTKYEYADLSSLPTTQAFYVGYAFKTFGVLLSIVAGTENSGTSAYPIVYAWNGTTGAWVSVGTLTDGTASGDYSMNHTGLVQWDGNSVTESKRTMSSILTPLYWYKIQWSAVLPAIHVYEVGQATKPETIPPMPQYDFVLEMSGRAMYGPGKVNRHGLDFSYPNLPHVVTGPLAGSTGNLFGPGIPNAASRLYMNAVISTKNPYRTYLLEGKVPGKWDELLLSDTVGCVAPHTMVYVSDAIRLFSQDRSVHAVFFLSQDGIYATDGQTVICISHQISKYWDLRTGPYIEPSYASNSYAWADYQEKTLHFAVPVNTAGTGTQTTLNREIVYNYVTGEWYDLYLRASPLACGFSFVGSDGEKLSYGGDYAGYVHKLNTGTLDNATTIDYHLKTSDLQPIDGKADAFNFISQLRSLKVKGKSGVTGTVDVDVYPDGATSAAVTSTGAISMVRSGYGYYSDKITFPDTLRGENFALKLSSGGESGANGSFLGFTMDFVPVRETF